MEQTTPERRVRLDKLPAPPTEARSPRRSSRVKKNPSITPNRFHKFFHPRLQDTKNKSVRTSRKALQKLSAANLNSRPKGNQVTFAADEGDGPPAKKRRLSFSSIPSIPSSPVTKSPANRANARDTGGGSIGIKGSVGTCLGLNEDDDADEDEDEEDDEYLGEHELAYRPRTTRYPSLSSSAGYLSRQIGARGFLRQANDSKLWQHETGSFYTLPDDVFTNSTNTTRERSLPFCATSFHQQESVAIGNEDGQIEIYRAWPHVEGYDGSLKFEGRMIPHDNAIMDMQFSPDDHFLATASGDQTCRIIDMNTRTGTHTLVGHVGSIKNVRWQPASGNKILATCSRDGSVCLWDLRCAQNALGSLKVKPLTRSPHFLNNSREVEPQTEIVGAHTPWDKVKLMNSKRPSVPLSSKADFAVTACAFISNTRPHMLATASEHNAIIKLWDLRASYKQRSGRPTPVSATAEPKSHELTRPFGVTSIVMSTDGSRLYTLCRDNTIYAYSTAHLVLGGSPEMNLSSIQAIKGSRSAGAGLGPLYGFRHEKLRLGSFYDKLSLRPKTDEHTELLAAGTGEDCAVLFPTDERYLAKAARTPFSTTASSASNHLPHPSLAQRAAASRKPTSFTYSTALHSSDPGATPMYYHGTPLINGHRKEVTCCAWIPGNGQLVTIADDYVARCWYEDDLTKARELRSNTGRDVARVKSGWAAVVAGWDEED
ncbi:hypothetical protein A1O7_08801 [Cladophialophora yegresii CBS 114405]|uniref:Uncharacterized protein n=1 Tax=Cladophialophora yegresii CBS 114405 TaxID=1182544 RepID=W9VSB5_9EURO|nr:uncharacterized protein A1O7_08801 [Cladophialophora yegresii CBS 114405]EXJ55870.1 hypothetical protein A1O7_08801 [Cladophialophora yegresii CBS 114405]